MIPVDMWHEEDRIFFKFGFNRTLMKAIKELEKPKWHGFDKPKPRKLWSVEGSYRNLWWLEVMKGNNPFARYDGDIPQLTPTRPELYDHQVSMFSHIMANRCVLEGAEMGVGKTLSLIEAMERAVTLHDFQDHDFLVVGTIASLKAVKLEMAKWNCTVNPTYMTYDALRIAVMNNEGVGVTIPKFACFDEISKLKNATSLRSQAAKWVTDKMRDNFTTMYIVGLTGTPAPKNPADWWHLAEIVQPGFLKEANVGAIQRRMSWVETNMTMQGQAFPKLKDWMDDENKCGHIWQVPLGEEEDGEQNFTERYCCELPNHPVHGAADEAAMFDAEETHKHVPSVNEVSKLYRRMKGLTQIFFKKDCLDLPDLINIFAFCDKDEWKQTDDVTKVRVNPKKKVARAAEHIVRTAPRVVTALTLLRELSDGFQYAEEPTGEFGTCKACMGEGREQGLNEQGEEIDEICSHCHGTCKIEILKRVTVPTHNPKAELLKERLDLHEDYGRYVVCCAFKGSTDIARQVANSKGWCVIQADGRGWRMFNTKGEPVKMKSEAMLKMFSREIDGPERICFVGHPGTMGMGLNLQASCELMWYSLPFNAEEYIQATDRIYRPGMDVVKGCTIVYAFHLGSDLMVYENLQKKKDLMALTMGAVKEATDV